MRVQETQHLVKGQKIVREYDLVGPKRETVESFFRWLVDHKTIESFAISK